jgi:hypothetical protein
MTRSNEVVDHPFLCPQCGSPTFGSLTGSGLKSSFCEDCVGDREINEGPFPEIDWSETTAP